MSDQSLPPKNIWLRSFYGFSPEEDGYIGWSQEGGRKHVMGKTSAGDLMMIYGAGTGDTASAQQLRILGFLQIEPQPIKDTEKASEAGMSRKRANGWADKWTYALPVRRAWRVVNPVRLDQIADETYKPEKGQSIAAWSPSITEAEFEKAMELQVIEVSVFGEPEVSAGSVSAPLKDTFYRNLENPLRPLNFQASFDRFQSLITLKSKEPLKRFDEGLIATWENYKPRVRARALELLNADSWTEDQIGNGTILASTILAIEIQATHGDLTNNMVFWQNRFGHAQRDHRGLLEAQRNVKEQLRCEQLLFDLFRGDRSEGAVFEDLRDITYSKYPLLAYLFFLKDSDRFMPIQPTGFDRVFREMDIDFTTLRNCSWENYQSFNSILDSLRGDLQEQLGLSEVRLIDAHSFCWVFASLIKQEANGDLETEGPVNQRVLGAREKSIADMKYSVNKTVFNSNGQIEPRKVKEKELWMTDSELDKRIRDLLDIQGDRCAITGLKFQFQGAHEDKNMLPSLDRINSDGHYEASNVQLVCRFINFWKQAAADVEFRRLIMLVRGEDEG